MLGFFTQVYKTVFCILLVTLASTTLYAQNSLTGIVQSFSVKDGLPSSTVYCSFQDLDGYLWFGTNNGVSKFNGHNFQNFSISDGLCDNNILNISQDSQGRIWFLSRSNCLCFLENGEILNSDSIQLLASETNNKGLLFFSEDDDNIYFSGEGNEVIKLGQDLKTKAIIVTNAPSGQLSFPVKSNGIVSYNSFLKQWPDSIYEEGQLIKYIFSKPSSHFTLSNFGVSKYLNGAPEVIITIQDWPELLGMEEIYVDNVGNIYCFSSKEIGLLFKKKEGKDGYIAYELPSISYSSVFVDSDNNQWFTSYDSGVHLISEAQKELTVYQYQDNEQTTCLTLTPFNEVLVGTSGNRILKFRGREMVDLIQIGAHNDVSALRAIAIDSTNNFAWSAGKFTLMGFPLAEEMRLYQCFQSGLIPLPLKEVNDIFPAADSLIYLSTLDGIYSLHLKDPVHTLKKLSKAPAKPSYNITQSKDGRIWFENNEILYYISNNELYEFTQPEVNFKTKITSLQVLEDNTLVVCTFGSGVYFIRNDKVIHHLSMKNGLLSDLCNELFIDGSRHYLATIDGVVIYDWDGNSSHVISTYTHLDGLPSNVINDVLVKDSLVYLASREGLIIFNSNYHSSYKAKVKAEPKLYVKQFKSKDRSFDFTNHITLTYDDSFINIDFEALSYIRSDEIIYEYKLNEDDYDWIKTKNNSLEFPRFEAGDYKFTLRARKHDSNWCEPVKLSFTSLPAWWASWWFRTLIILALGFLSFLVMRFFAKRKYERQLAEIQKEQALLEERNRISADMHDDLGSELTKIVILSRIARTKLALDRSREQPIIDIDNAATDIVKKMNEIIWALNPANDSLESLVSYLQKYANDYLEVRDLYGRVEMPKAVPELKVKAAFRRNVFLIVKECLHNIHKHSQADRVDMSIRISDDLNISIIENGIGFDMEKTKRFGNGLINMKKRANDLNGDVDQESSLGNGSSLNMVIPLIKNHAFVLDDN